MKLNLIAILFLTTLIRFGFCQNGSLDLTFGSNGIVTTSFVNDIDVGEIVIQGDGKILMVGTINEGTNEYLCVQRFLVDGLLDPTFGVDGSLVLIGTRSIGEAIKVQSDGKIVVAGSMNVLWNNYDGLLLRLNEDGSFDTDFGDNGISTFNFNGAEFFRSVAIDLNGQIIAAGGVANIGGCDLITVKFNSDGSLDSTFQYNGMSLIHILSTYEFGEDCLIQPDGKIVIVGERATGSFDVMLVRLNSNGSLDTSFGVGGIVYNTAIARDNRGITCSLQANGKILVAGHADMGSLTAANFDVLIVRYNADGSLDSSFNGSGIVTCDLAGGNDYGMTIEVLVDGSIVIAASGEVNGLNHFAMVRYTEDGILDSSFGEGGRLTYGETNQQNACQAMAVGADNHVILAGESFSGSSSDNKKLKLVSFYIGEHEIKSQTNLNGISVYPNPIADNSILRYSLEQNDKVSILVYDATGSLVQIILQDEYQVKGEKAVHLKLNEALAHGLYSVRVKSSSSLLSIEIIK